MPRKATGRQRNKQLDVTIDPTTKNLLQEVCKGQGTTTTQLIEQLTLNTLQGVKQTFTDTPLPLNLGKRSNRVAIRVSEEFYEDTLGDLLPIYGCKSLSTAIYRMLLEALYTEPNPLTNNEPLNKFIDDHLTQHNLTLHQWLVSFFQVELCLVSGAGWEDIRIDYDDIEPLEKKGDRLTYEPNGELKDLIETYLQNVEGDVNGAIYNALVK